MMPTSSTIRVDSYKSLLDSNKLTMPEWIEPLLKVAYFMHYFNAEAQLPLEILKEVHDQTKLDNLTLDHILVLSGIPTVLDDSGMPKYSEAWMREQIISVITKHGARLLNPESDIKFPQPDSVVIILDGYDSLAPEAEEKDKDSKREDDGSSTSEDDDGDDKGDQAK
jgi:hypothetical protein